VIVDALWPAFIVVCALAGIGLAVAWIRVQRRPEQQLERLEQRARELRRRQRKSGPPTGPGASPPPPTPDLVSVQEAWQHRADSEEHPPSRVVGLGPQTADDPTTPRKALPGMQGLIPGATPSPKRNRRGKPEEVE
jgi:hypothetical protein